MLASGMPAPKSATVVSVKPKLTAAVVKLQLSSAPSALPPDPLDRAVDGDRVDGARIEVGVRVERRGVPRRSSRSPARRCPDPCFRRRTVVSSIVAGFIASLNWTWTLVFRATSVAFGAGLRLVIVGGVWSWPTV